MVVGNGARHRQERGRDWFETGRRHMPDLTKACPCVPLNTEIVVGGRRQGSGCRCHVVAHRLMQRASHVPHLTSGSLTGQLTDDFVG